MMWDLKIHRSQPAPIPTPCIGICELGSDDCCVGCFRNGDEISRWRDMSASERQHLMDAVLPQREAARALGVG